LQLLVDTAGADVTDTIMQNISRVNSATYIGKGKVLEIKQLVGKRETDLVIFDDELTPIQLRNLEKTLECKLLDRSALILDIFAKHARTATAKTQVELAQLEYLRTRLTRHWTHLSRQKGGIGTKGPGETQIETDRRLIGQRISTLKARLEKIDKQRTSQRKGRTEHTRVSLVGYTNAGKSTLMNAVANTSVVAENRLFATLDSTTRTVFIAPGRQILLSDTVGFIKKLPHRLIESFKSTLDEVRESDILLHVVDVTHDRFEEQMRVVDETLMELDVTNKPTLLVFNKIDAITDPEQLSGLQAQYPEAAFISAQRGIGLKEFRQQLLAVIESDFSETVLYLPIEEQRTIAHIRKIGEVLSEEYMKGQIEYEDAILDVVRLHFRTAPRYDGDVRPLVARFQHMKPVGPKISVISDDNKTDQL
jgi:GTP-binding protein HflX